MYRLYRNCEPKGDVMKNLICFILMFVLFFMASCSEKTKIGLTDTAAITETEPASSETAPAETEPVMIKAKPEDLIYNDMFWQTVSHLADDYAYYSESDLPAGEHATAFVDLDNDGIPEVIDAYWELGTGFRIIDLSGDQWQYVNTDMLTEGTNRLVLKDLYRKTQEDGTNAFYIYYFAETETGGEYFISRIELLNAHGKKTVQREDALRMTVDKTGIAYYTSGLDGNMERSDKDAYDICMNEFLDLPDSPYLMTKTLFNSSDAYLRTQSGISYYNEEGLYNYYYLYKNSSEHAMIKEQILDAAYEYGFYPFIDPAELKDRISAEYTVDESIAHLRGMAGTLCEYAEDNLKAKICQLADLNFDGMPELIVNYFGQIDGYVMICDLKSGEPVLIADDYSRNYYMRFLLDRKTFQPYVLYERCYTYYDGYYINYVYENYKLLYKDGNIYNESDVRLASELFDGYEDDITMTGWSFYAYIDEETSSESIKKLILGYIDNVNTRAAQPYSVYTKFFEPPDPEYLLSKLTFENPILVPAGEIETEPEPERILFYSEEYDLDYTVSQYGAVLSDYRGDAEHFQIPYDINGNRVHGIGSGAFSGGLASVLINRNISFIGDGAFSNCKDLEEITADEYNYWYSNDENGILFDKDKTVLIAWPANKPQKSYTVPGSVREIRPGAFRNSKLEEIVIGDGVKYIGDYAFADCAFLKGITIGGDNIPFLNETHFYGNAKLPVLRCAEFDENACWTFPAWTSPLGLQFRTEIIIPDETINENFTYTVDDGNKTCVIVKYKGSGGRVIIPDTVEGCAVTGIADGSFRRAGITGVFVPGSVRRIGDEAFAGNGNLHGVTLSEGIAEIGVSAFGGCGLQKVVIPDSVTFIGEGAFAGGYALESVKLGKGMIKITGSCFSGCPMLQEIVIPWNIGKIGKDAFAECGKLKSVYYTGNAPDIAGDAFRGCAEDLVFYYFKTKTGWSENTGGHKTAKAVCALCGHLHYPAFCKYEIICLHGDSVYFKKNGNLYKADAYGNKVKKITFADPIHGYRIYGSYIYYVGVYADNFYFFRMNGDGSRNIIMNKDIKFFDFIFAGDGYIYGYLDEYKCRMKQFGSEREILDIDSYIYDAFYDNGYLYFKNEERKVSRFNVYTDELTYDEKDWYEFVENDETDT